MEDVWLKVGVPGVWEETGDGVDDETLKVNPGVWTEAEDEVLGDETGVCGGVSVLAGLLVVGLV